MVRVIQVTHLSTLGIVEPLQQLHHGALATPTSSHQSHRLTNFNLQGKLVQDLEEKGISFEDTTYISYEEAKI